MQLSNLCSKGNYLVEHKTLTKVQHNNFNKDSNISNINIYSIVYPKSLLPSASSPIRRKMYKVFAMQDGRQAG